MWGFRSVTGNLRVIQDVSTDVLWGLRECNGFSGAFQEVSGGCLSF